MVTVVVVVLVVVNESAHRSFPVPQSSESTSSYREQRFRIGIIHGPAVPAAQVRQASSLVYSPKSTVVVVAVAVVAVAVVTVAVVVVVVDDVDVVQAT